MRSMKAVVQYDGTDYFGFQKQPGRRTIQGEIEQALHQIMKEPVRVTGAGRTDAGVHALGQVISLRTNCGIPIERVCIALNSVLPKDIVLAEAEEVCPEFNARRSARFRTYEYLILNTEYPSALLGRYAWWMPEDLDLRAMRRAASHLVGTHDFSAFALNARDDKTTVRELVELSLHRRSDVVRFTLTANAFLHSMVRGIVGTLVEVGQGRRSPGDVKSILESRDRSMAGRTAPPQGLFLVHVTY